MFGIGSTELLVILLVGLIVLGPKSLASLSRTLGKVVGEFRRVSTDFQRTLNAEAAAEEVVKDQSLIAEPAEKVEEANEEELRRAKLEARKNEALAKAQAAKESKLDLDKKTPVEKSPLEKALAKASEEAKAYEQKTSKDPVKQA